MTGNSGLAGAVQALAADPNNSQLVYAGTTQGIYKSVNGGADWTRIDSGLTYSNVRALAIRPEAPCTIVAGIDTNIRNQGGYPNYYITNSNGVLAVGTDCGANWGIPAGGPSGRRTESVAFSNTVPSVLYAAIVANDADCGFTCIDLEKGSVAQLTLGTGGSVTRYFFSLWATNVVATDPGNACTAYYALNDYGYGSWVYQNTSCSGGTWTNVGSFDAAVLALAVHPTNGTVLAGTSAGGIYQKIDAGSPWVSVATVSGAINSIQFEPASSSVAYAITSSGSVYKTTDGGGAWTLTNTIGSPLRALAISPTSTSSVYVGGKTFVLNIGASVTRVISLSGNLAFGSAPLGTTVTRPLTISNTGSAVLTVAGITYPAGFSGAWSGTIPAGGSQTVTVAFAPTSATTYSGTVTVNADQTAGTNTLAVSGQGTAPLTFTEDPLQPGGTRIKAVHLSELRSAIEALRVRYVLAPVTWTDQPLLPGVTVVKAAHLTELRTGLDAVYAAAGRTPPTYATPGIQAGTTVITATHIAELRAAIQAIW